MNINLPPTVPPSAFPSPSSGPSWNLNLGNAIKVKSKKKKLLRNRGGWVPVGGEINYGPEYEKRVIKLDSQHTEDGTETEKKEI